MKRKLRGMKRRAIQLDFNLYRVDVPMPGLADAELSVIDIQPEGVERTIMFVHGYAGVAETWEYQINHFAHDYRVVAPDLRGHGQSDAPFTQYTMPELVGDLHAIAEALDLPQRFVLAGHSFGGSICVEYANAHPDRLEKLILIATGGEYPLPRVVSLAYRIPTAAFRPFWRYRPRWNAEIHVMKRMMLNNMRRWQGWPLLRNIRTPTLVITGARDTYFPHEVFAEVATMVPDAEVVDVGASKHKVQLERYQAVNRAIERFLTGGERGSWREERTDAGLVGQRPWIKSYGRDTPATVPIPHQPVHRFLESAADWVPRQTATIFYGERLTYRELERQANQFAHTLRGLGVRPGERVAIALPNIPQMVVAYYGTLKAGGVVVLPNPDADAAQIIRQVVETDSKVLVTLTDFSRLAQQVRERTNLDSIVFADISAAVSGGIHRQLISRWQAAGVGGADGDDATSPRDRGAADREEARRVGFLMDRLMMDAARDAPGVDVAASDLAAVLYTSGTSDVPKGVCLTHANLVANVVQIRHWIPDLRYGAETFLSVVPLTHSYGMTSAMNLPVAMAARIVLLPTFDLGQLLQSIKSHRPTIFPGVPSLYMAINQAPGVRSYGLESIKACISGAAPLPVEVQEAFEKLTRGRLVEGYGLTEASPVTHANPLYGVRKVGSIGVPIPNTDARIGDLETGEPLAAGQIGELAVRGPQVMRGYWGERVAGDSQLRDGWLYTGDVAVMDTDGYFFVLSRKRDTIMAGDYSVYPRDVEEVLYEHAKVMEAAVVGIQAAEDAERVKAFVVPRPGTDLTKQELIDLCRRRLADYAVPYDIEFRDSLPKSFVGKVLRRLLVEQEAARD